jgi:Spy/CpxP family protein refolding chaperone
MKKIFVLLLSTIFILTSFTGLSMAQGMTQGNGSGFGHHMGDYYGNDYNRNDSRRQDIQLSQKQREQIAELKTEFYQANSELRIQLQDLNFELRNMQFKGASYEELGKLEDQIADLEQQLWDKREANFNKIKEVLTEEQRQYWTENNNYNGYRGRFSGRRMGYNYGYGMHSQSYLNNYHHYGMMNGYGNYGMMGSGYGTQNFGNHHFGSGWCY